MTELTDATTPAPPRHACTIVSDQVGSVRVVSVAGRLDWATAGDFRDRMREEWTDPMVVVDFSDTESMDSAGTGVLLAATARAVQRGQQLAIVSVDPVATDVLRSVWLGLVIPIVGSQAEAFRWLHDHDPPLVSAPA